MKKLVCCICSLAAFALAAQPALSPVRPHPRLFADAAGFEETKARLEGSAEGRGLMRRLLRRCEDCMTAPLAERRMEGKRLLDVSQAALSRIAHLAFAWRVTGERRFADRAIAEARAVCAFSDWNPSHFLDTAEMTLAVAIARDWLDGALSPEDKAEFVRAIVEKGLTTGDGVTLQTGWWERVSHNWNQVCHGGLAAGAAAIREDFPELAERVLRRSRERLPLALKSYEGGNFPEGPLYWGYASDFTAIALAVLEREFADGAADLFAMDGIADQPDYLNAVTGPTGIFFSYSDCGYHGIPKRGPYAASWYFARHYGRADAMIPFELPLLLKGGAAGRLHPMLLLWMTDDWRTAKPRAKDLCHVFGGVNPIAVLRTGWGADDWYVGVKGGSPSVNHGHMDAGSFVLDAGGVRWAVDLNCEPYNRIEQMKTISLWKMGQESSRWTLFRLGTAGHNTLMIDGAQQLVKGCAGIVPAAHGADVAGAVSVDLTSLYPAASRVTRGFALRGKGGLAVRDELEGLAPGAVVAWGMNTSAKVAKIDGRRLVLEAEGADGKPRRMTLVASSGDVEWEVESLEKPRTPADSPNPGMTRVGFRRFADATGSLRFGVAFSLAEDAP